MAVLGAWRPDLPVPYGTPPRKDQARSRRARNGAALRRRDDSGELSSALSANTGFRNLLTTAHYRAAIF